jgi:hypothetical protein
MATQSEAAAALETIARDVAEKYGADIVLVAVREILRSHLTPEGAIAAEEAADAVWRERNRPPVG